MRAFALDLEEERARRLRLARKARAARWRSLDACVEALRLWARAHDGVAPRQRDWSPSADPEFDWPRAKTVMELGAAAARERGLRWEVRSPPCECCWPPYSHGDTGEHEGFTGWGYALHLAGLDLDTTRAALRRLTEQRLARVEGGAGDA